MDFFPIIETVGLKFSIIKKITPMLIFSSFNVLLTDDGYFVAFTRDMEVDMK